MVETQGVGFTQATKTVNNLQGSLGTGPAAYNPEKRKMRNISYTMGSRLDDVVLKKNNAKPGPANYETSSVRNSRHGRTASFSFGKGLRQEEQADRDLKANPGAAQYTMEFAPLLTKAPEYRFGSALRVELKSKLNVPGPGAYTSKSLGREAPSQTIG